jgi:transcriptional regulator with XRE-family HTH domain
MKSLKSHKESDFGHNLNLILREKNISQSALAKLTLIKPQNLNKYLSGKRSPTLNTAIKIARILDIDINRLTGQTATSIGSFLNKEELYKIFLEATEKAYLTGVFENLSIKEISEVVALVKQLGGWGNVKILLQEEVALMSAGEKEFQTTKARVFEKMRSLENDIKSKKRPSRVSAC